MQEDPLGILKGSEDPLGILKKKDGGSVSQKPAQSPLIASQTEAEQPTQSPFVDPEELKKRYERVALGTNTLNSVIENKYSKDPLFAKSSSQFIRNSNELNAKGMKPERTSLVYDFFNKDINSDDNIRDSFISSQYAGAYFSESPELKSEYEKSDLKDVLTPRQYTGLKSLSFGKQSKYQDYVKKLKEANELDKEVAKIELDKIGVDIDQDAAASMYNEGLNVDIANNIYSKAKNDSPLLDERLRQIDYENPYSLRTFGNIVTGAVNRGLTVGSTADILTATADEAGVDVDRLAQLQKDLNNSKATKAYEQFSNDPSIENFKKNPIGILLEQGLESLAALYSHGATRMAAGAGTGAAMGSIVPGVGTAAGASSGVIAGLGMASLNLEYSSKILEGLGQLGVDVTDAAQLKNALADDKIMADLKADGLKKGVPVALFDMLSAGIAGKIISKPAKSIAGRVMQGAAETGVQSALGAAGEATGQIVSEGKITSPNAILMEAIGELGPGTIEIAYGNAVEAAKRNRSISKKDIVAISKSAEAKNNIDAEIASGNLTEEQGALLKKEVATVEANLNKVPQDLSDGAKAQLVDLVDKKSKLIEQEKNLDAAFKPEIQNQIKEIDNQILNITKSDRDATTESSKPVQEGAAESNIGEPTGVVQGQREGGTGEGIQGEATIPKADVGDSNLGSEAKITPDQISVSNDPTDFATQMQSAQSSLGKAGMSVSPYTQEAYDEVASEGGKFLRAADNKVLALLKPSGEMVSLVKDATVKAKGAAQAMISKMKDMGGLFMDNYDIYLTPIYEKAGYKVVARVPFDEQYAPEGWNEQDSPLKNKPDVVFMVRNDIPAQEQTFTEYGDAQNYVKGIVDSAVSSGIAKTPAQMDIETELTQELIKEPVAKVQQSLKSAGITVDLIADPAEFDRQVQQLGGQAGMEGVFLAEDGKVLLNEQKLKEGTNAGRIIFHEATHPIINIIRNTKPELYNRVVAGINAASDNPAIQQAKAWVESNKNVYDTDVKKEDETLVETIAMVGDGTLDLNTIETGFKQALIEVINTIARALGFKPVLNDTDIAAFKKLAAQIADVLTSGRDIAEVVGRENVREFQATGVQARAKDQLMEGAADLAKQTESKTVDGRMQPSMILTAMKGGKESVVYSGPASIESMRELKPKMYISRAEELAQTHLFSGKKRMYPSTASSEQKLKWADDVYNKAKQTVVSNLLYIYDSIPQYIRDISKLWYDGANIIAQEMASKYGFTLEQTSAVIATQSPQKPWYDNVHLAHFIIDMYANKQDMVFSQEMFDYYASKANPSATNKVGYPKQIEYLPTLRKSIGKPFSELSNYDKAAMVRADFDNNYERTAPLRIPTGIIVGRVDAPSSFSGYDTIAKGLSILENGSAENISTNLGNAYKVRNFNNNIVNPRADDEVTIDTHAIAASYMLPLGSKSPEVKFDEATYAFFADAYREAAKQRGVLAREMQSITWEGARSLFPDTEKSANKKKAAQDLWNGYKDGTEDTNVAQQKIKENGKDLSVTDWSRFTDQLFEENRSPNYLEELPLAGRGGAAAGLRDGGRDIGGVPTMGEGSVQPSAGGGLATSTEGQRGTNERGQPVAEGTPDPITPSPIQASAGRRATNKDITGKVSKKLIDDGEGNYVFFHYSPNSFRKVNPRKFGSNLFTGRDEQPGVNVSMFYVNQNDKEGGLIWDYLYISKIPKGQVYPFNEDPLDLIKEAKAEFVKQYGNKAAFDPNKQLGFVTKVAADRGFPMTVAQWTVNGKKTLRAQTTEALPVEYYQRIKSGTMNQIETNPKYKGIKFDKSIQASAGNRLAPNGKPSNLTEKQYQQVRTPEFKNWFGDWENDPANASKVVDENGEPLVVYHGTKNKFDEFDPTKMSWEARLSQQGPGFYFTNNKKAASGYGKPLNTYVSIKNPLEIKDLSQNITKEQAIELFSNGDYDWFYTNYLPFITKQTGSREELLDKYISDNLGRGFDKFVLKNIKRAYTQEAGYGNLLNNMKDVLGVDGIIEKPTKTDAVYVALSPNQIKSATANVGTFSTEDARIQFSAGNRPENNQNFKLAAFVMRKKAEGATDGEIAIGIASVTGMKPEDIKTIIDNPEQFIRDSFPSMSKLQQDNLIQKAKIQDIYRGRQFGKPIDKPFIGLEVPQEMVDDYLDKTGRADRNVKDWAKDFKRKWLDPAKGLPDWTLAIKDFATGAKNIEVARAANTVQRLKEVAKQIGFKDWDAFSEALVAAKDVQRFIPDETGVVPFDVYRAAANRTFATPDDKLPALVPDAIKKLPDEIIPFAYAMRGQIDNLTRDLIGSGYVTPEQAVTLEKNLGAYTNRAYKMFSERGYVPEKKVYNAAVKFLAQQKMPAIANDNVGVLTDKQIVEKAMEEAKKDVEAILNKKNNPFFNASTDRRDTGILQERKDIPEPIRDLMGQYTDPGTVFIMTVAKQAALKSASQYLNKLRTMGMGSLFFEREDPSRPASHSVEIAAKGTESMNPLGGLYTTPEIAEAISMIEPTYNELTQAWMKAVGAVRWGKTVGSVATQFKNLLSNGGFAVLNGYMLSGENTQAFKAAAKYVKGQYSKGEIDAITDKVIRLNLVGQSVGMRELKEMLGSGDVHDIALDIALNPEGKWGKRVAKKYNPFAPFNKFYRLGDDVWKVYAYMVEREQIADARFNGAKYDSLTKQQQEQVDIESSERVKNTWPTYDRVVEGAKFVSKRAPIFGNFISFQAESLRSLTNSIKLAKQDLSDPQMRHLGVRRMAGITAYIGLRSAITIGLAEMAGFAAAGVLGSIFGDDEEERNKRAIREALPPFMRTGDLAVTQGDKPHQYTVVNLSSIDPYGVVPNSLNAFTEGREGIFSRTMEPGVLAAGAEFFSGFLEPEMTFESMWSAINDINPKTGERITMETDTDLQATAKIAAAIWDQLEPSTVAMIQRLFERENKSAELLALGGARPYDVDLHKSFGFVLSRFGKDIDAINKEYNSIKYNDKMTEQEKEAAEKVAEDKKAFAISKVSQIYRDFINIGADPKVLDELINQKSAVKVTGYDPNTKKSIKTGKINKEKLFK